MFDKKDLSVSLEVVENKIKEVTSHYESEIERNTEYFCNMINSMKNNCNIKGILKADYPISNNEFSIGTPTNYYSNGIQLYTGDEVQLVNGRKGFVAFQNNTLIIMTNYHRYPLHEKNNIKIDFKVIRNFNEYSLGDIVAIGRNDGKGFIVKKLGLVF